MFEPTIGIVIPTYNRSENLKRCLGILSWQTKQDFVIVVADDGSTDGTQAVLAEMQNVEFWSERLIYVNCGPRHGVRTGRARNLGAAALPPSVKLLIQLDTDMLLVSSGLESFWKWYEQYPNAILIPELDWLPEMPDAQISDILEKQGFGGLSDAVPNVVAQRVNGTYVGRELRLAFGLVYTTDPQPIPFRTEWYLPGVLGFGLDLYWKAGGSDEAMHGYGYQDIDLGTRLANLDLECIALAEIWAGHVWHPSSTQGNLTTAQRNVDYIIRKYQRMGLREDLIDFYRARCDWEHWWHYNRERGTTLAQVGEGETAEYWAINQARTHRMQLPDLEWAWALGFREQDVFPTPAGALDAIKNMGVAYDPLGDGLDYFPPPPTK